MPTQLSCSPLFTTHTHVHTQPQDDDSMSSATDGEADQPTSPDRQQDPEQGNSVQDLIQQAFSCTTLSTQQGIGNISMSLQTTATLWEDESNHQCYHSNKHTHLFLLEMHGVIY